MSTQKIVNCPKTCGGRIKFLRKKEGLKQESFAEVLGITRQHISNVETHKSNPSNHLLVSICRAFRVNMAWLRDGAGDIYDMALRLTPQGNRVMEEIETRLRAPTRTFAVYEIARLMGFDPDDPKSQKFSGDEFHDLIVYIIQLIDEGDKGKIETVTNFLKLLQPKKK